MDYENLAVAIATWLRDYAEQARAKGYVVGLSGGIDSSVTAALAVKAVGLEHVVGVLMPCHSESEDSSYARMLAEALDLQTETVDLTETYDALAGALPEGSQMACANTKPRLRMTTLYYLAHVRGYLVAGTGNRPEMMVGYFTKYGDGGVDLEPLGELYKHEVRELGRVLGVPDPIIERAPSAGLWPGQTDEDELGITYDELDAILDAIATGAPMPASPETVARVRQMIAASAHKRAAPPTFPVAREAEE